MDASNSYLRDSGERDAKRREEGQDPTIDRQPLIPSCNDEWNLESRQQPKRRKLSPVTVGGGTNGGGDSPEQRDGIRLTCSEEEPVVAGHLDGDIPEVTVAWLKRVRLQVAAYQKEGRLSMAKDLLQDALLIASRAVDQGILSPSYLAKHFLATLADTCYQLGDTAEAIDHYTSAVKIERLAK